MDAMNRNLEPQIKKLLKTFPVVARVELSTLKMNEFKAKKTSSLYNIFNKKLSKKDLPTLKRLKPTKTFHEIKYSSITVGKQLLAMTNFLKLHKLPYGIVINNCTTPSLVTENIIQIPTGCL